MKGALRYILLALVFCDGVARRRIDADVSSPVMLPSEAREHLERHEAAVAQITVLSTETQSGDAAQPYGGPTSFLTCFDGPRFYQKRRQINRTEGGRIDRFMRGAVYKTAHEDAFDGEIASFGEADLGDPNQFPVLTKYLASDLAEPDRTKRLFTFPYFQAAGYYTPSSLADLQTFRSVRSLVLRALEQSQSTTVQSGDARLRVSVRVPDPLLKAAREIDLEKHRKLLQSGKNPPAKVEQELEDLRRLQAEPPTRTIVFLLDPHRGYSVAESEEFTASAKRISRTIAENWKYFPSADIWLPGRCTVSYFTNPYALREFSDNPQATIVLEAQSIELRPPTNVAFNLDYTRPGSIMVDHTSEEARKSPAHKVVSTAPAKASDLRTAADGIARELNSGRYLFWLMLNAALIVALGIALVLRRRAQRKAG